MNIHRAILSNRAESNLSTSHFRKTFIISKRKLVTIFQYNDFEYLLIVSQVCFIKRYIPSQKKEIKDWSYRIDCVSAASFLRPKFFHYHDATRIEITWGRQKVVYHVSHMVKRENATWRRCGPFVNDRTESVYNADAPPFSTFISISTVASLCQPAAYAFRLANSLEKEWIK